VAATEEPEAPEPIEPAPEHDALATDAHARDLWSDDDDHATPPYVRYAQIGLIVLAVLVIGIVVLVNASKDDKDDKASNTDTSGQTADPADGTSGGTTKNAKPIWPKEVEGRPAALGKRGQTAPTVKSTANPGVYVWSDFDGWHMWVQGGLGMPERVTGTLTSNDPIARADLAVPDTGTVNVQGKTVTFDLDTTRGLTGMDFNTGFYGKRLVFLLNGPDGQPIDQQLIKTGSRSVAAVYPLVIEKA
jgi:hypothetical protein